MVNVLSFLEELFIWLAFLFLFYYAHLHFRSLKIYTKMKSVTTYARQALRLQGIAARGLLLTRSVRPAQLRVATNNAGSSVWISRRFNTGLAPSNNNNSNNNDDGDGDGDGKAEKPSYHLSFTCKKCDTRSGHVISKQAYHGGTVLVQCPGCKSRHLIADHLKVSVKRIYFYIYNANKTTKIFSDERVTLEDILAKKGQTIKKGVTHTTDIKTRVTPTGDIEIETVKPE